MALQTKTMTYAGPRGYTLKLVLTEESIDTATNTSSVSYSLQLVSTTYNYGQYGTGYEVIINGTQVAFQDRSDGIKTSINKNSTLVLCSGTTTIVHNNDGSKTTSAEASLDIGGSPAPGAMSIDSENWTLTVIPRASTFTISNGTLNTAQNIVITSNANTFRHTLRYTCGSTSGTINSTRIPASNATSVTQSWTPALSLAAQNTSGTTVSVTVYCDTYTAATGGTLVGTTSKTVTMTIPASVAPTVTNVSLSDPTGKYTTFGAYIQNVSKLTVSYTASGAQGSTINSHSIKVGTKLTYSTAGVTTDLLPESGSSIAVTITITDSRGRTGTATQNINVVAYTKPTVTSNFIRTDSGGTASTDGAYGKVTFSSTVSPISVGGTSKNTATYKVKYKQASASTYSTSTLSAYANNYSVSNGSTVISMANATAWDAYIEVTDAISSASSVVIRIPSASVFFKADPENNAFSFGKLETAANTFQVAWNSVFDGNLDSANRIWSYTNIYAGKTDDTNARYVHARNQNGSVSIAISTNKGLYDDDRSNGVSNWIIYRDTAGKTHIPGIDPFYYGTCTTAAATQAKAATVSSNFELATGSCVRILFSNAQTYNGTATLNVNSTGAKNIVSRGTSGVGQYGWNAGEVIDFCYNGTSWVRVDGGEASTTYWGITKLSSATNSTSASMAATPAAVKSAYDLAAAAVPKAGSMTQVWSNTSGATSGNWASFTSYSAYVIMGRVQNNGSLISITIPRALFVNTTTASSGLNVVMSDEASYLTVYLYYSDTTGYFSRKGATSSSYGKVYYVYGVL